MVAFPDEMSEDDVKNHKMDKVRAQQKENWFNQRAIHRNNKAQGQGVVFNRQGQETHYITQEQLSSKAARTGNVEGGVSQRELAEHLKVSGIPLGEGGCIVLGSVP